MPTKTTAKLPEIRHQKQIREMQMRSAEPKLIVPKNIISQEQYYADIEAVLAREMKRLEGAPIYPGRAKSSATY